MRQLLLLFLRQFFVTRISLCFSVRRLKEGDAAQNADSELPPPSQSIPRSPLVPLPFSTSGTGDVPSSSNCSPKSLRSAASVRKYSDLIAPSLFCINSPISRVRQLIAELVQEQPAPLFRQPFNRRPQCLFPFAPLYRGLRFGTPFTWKNQPVDREEGPPALVSMPVGDQVVGNAEQPRAEGQPPVLVPVQPVQSPVEDTRRQVFRVLNVLHPAVYVRIDAIDIAFVQFAKCLWVPLRLRHQGRFSRPLLLLLRRRQLRLTAVGAALRPGRSLSLSYLITRSWL